MWASRCNNGAPYGHMWKGQGLSGSLLRKKTTLWITVSALSLLGVALLLHGPVDAMSGRAVLIVGDSVLAALSSRYTNTAQSIIGGEVWRVTLDAEVCRKSTTPGCLHGSPLSALEILRRRQHRQSTLVVIMVGHNDDRGTTFRKKVSALFDEVGDAPQVFWVSMREVSTSYIVANRVITEEAARRPNVQVIPWAEASRHHSSWVARDGTHLTTIGATQMAVVIRQALQAWHLQEHPTR